MQNGSSSTQVHDRWTLLDGTPATCVNIALHNLALPPIDLVLSGPNMGRNVTNLTFASGTIGGALEGVLCGKKAIAVSFAFYKGIEYTDSQVILASQRACALIRQIWDSWTPDLGVDLWNINVPILPLDASEPAIHMTEIQRITHGGFFSPVQSYSTLDGTPSRNAYRFAPQFPFGMEEPEDGTDAWAIDRKMISVTPIRATWNVVELGRVKEGLGAIAKGWSLPPS